MAEIKLTRGLVAKVDDADFPSLSAFNWHARVDSQGKVYAVRRESVANGRAAVYMHRQILCAPEGSDVDHINGESLDNRRSNLRVVSRSENILNSKYRSMGVSYCKQTERWYTRIKHDGRRIWLGRYAERETAEQIAATARDMLSRGARVEGLIDLVSERVLNPPPTREAKEDSMTNSVTRERATKAKSLK